MYLKIRLSKKLNAKQLLVVLLLVVIQSSLAQDTIRLVQKDGLFSKVALVNPKDSIIINIGRSGYEFSKSAPDNEYYIYNNDVLSLHVFVKNGKKNGVATRYDKNGVKFSENTLKDDQLDGMQEFFYKNGEIKSVLYYTNGVVDGECINFYKDERIKKAFFFNKGKKNGTWKTYFYDGQLQSVEQYIDGKPEGKWKYFYHLGKIKYEKEYRNGQPVGTWAYYNHDESINTECTCNKEKILIKNYSINGKLERTIFIKNTEKEDKWQTYLEDGILVTHFHNAIEENLLKSYDNYASIVNVFPVNNQNLVKEKIYLKDGNLFYLDEKINKLLDGKVVEYYKNAYVSRVINYENGKPQGVCKKFYTDGLLNLVQNYSQKNNSNDWVKYNEEGDVIESGHYVNEKKTGEWKTRFRNGDVIRIIVYENDEKQFEKWEYYTQKKLYEVDVYGKNIKIKSTIYHPNGKVYKVEKWNDKRLLAVNACYNELGKTLKIGSLKNANGTVYEYTPEGLLMNTAKYNNGKLAENSISIDQVWNDDTELNNYAWKVYEKETNSNRLKQAVIWVKRSIELKETNYNLDTYAALLYKLGNYKKALTQAEKAVKFAKKTNEKHTETSILIEKIKQKIK
jgi:antitoxin component YwqK of YwqJK toxin-antitoxin module